jgi:hypothetical protein
MFQMVPTSITMTSAARDIGFLTGWLQWLTSLTPVQGQAPRPPVVGAPGLPGRA